MSGELQPGQVLQERFVLDRLLHRRPSSELWSARDRQLETRLLLRVHVIATLLDTSVLESIKLGARNHRRLHHPHVARIHDVHEGDGLLLVSIEHYDGDLLTTDLDRAAPPPYRAVVGAARPLVEALLHMHDDGSQHGRLHPDHVLVDDEGRWILLPADGSRPLRNDIRQLGTLVRAALTGEIKPPDTRPLNDVADRLHGGRTIPALLAQLVADLEMDEPTLRPASMREVIQRFDQLEEVVIVQPSESAPPASTTEAPAPEPPTAPPAAEAPPRTPVSIAAAPRRRNPRTRRVVGIILMWIVVPAVITIGALMVLRHDGEATDDPAPPADIATSDDPTTPSAEDEERARAEMEAAAAEAAEAARVAVERQAAEAALDREVAARSAVDTIGGNLWGGESYDGAAQLAAEGDQAFLSEAYVDATERYDNAASAFARVEADQQSALVRLLEEGQIALDAPKSEAARVAFETALMIDPGNQTATTGARRAGTLDELHRLLDSGREHEAAGRLSFAHADFAAAAQLDPLSTRATEAYAAIKQRLSDDEFQAMMSHGLEAFHDGDYDEARRRLIEAQQFRPESTEVVDALTMVDEARLRREVERLRESALAHEGSEQWQAAWRTYRQALAIDANVQFAQEGKQRCEAMIELEKVIEDYLERPDKLVHRGTRDEAVEFAETLEAMPNKGPRLQRSSSKLAELVRLANTPQRVILQSDGKTSVDVYRVGRYGTFRSVELDLLPGEYTVVGHRIGYKDVRLQLELRPGAEGTTLEVICKESI